ncbi:MAG: phosphatase PAP2 family protein [Anaerolineales bacterium]|jgi:membrane-associated phospholipid phosphatase|nr:phosphatase PAP2 family protein [Chloroflexota bacterium]MBK6647951.1 phosphatase PAP2 family protein [Anaerolineales bacterium]MCC6985141.1 phosphatase PAP2 family protein [Anaerolineales bacterium]
MQTLIDFGISLIIALQRAEEWVYPIMDFFSQLGTEDFFFIVMPMVYWSVDAALGIRTGVILLGSVYINTLGKVLFAGPRPYWVSSHVRPLWPESSFGVPSGHAQHAMSIWGMAAVVVKKTWFTALCIFLIFMIGFSRLVLGAHFPHDVVVGWLLGGGLVWAVNRYWDVAARWLSGKSFAQHVQIASLITLFAIVLGLAVYALRSDFEIPWDWMANAVRSGMEPEPVDPNSLFTSAGTFFGMAFGAAWIHSMGGYQARGPVWKRGLRYVAGLVGILILWQGLGAVFPRNADVLSYLLRFIRYALVGWWIIGGAPWIFKHFNLTTS